MMKVETNASGVSRIPSFVGEVRQEVKKVSWPSRRETVLTTAVVFVFALVAAVYFMVVDQIIYRSLHWIIG
jgi:preprotein translocase subunit SecE